MYLSRAKCLFHHLTTQMHLRRDQAKYGESPPHSSRHTSRHGAVGIVTSKASGCKLALLHNLVISYSPLELCGGGFGFVDGF